MDINQKKNRTSLPATTDSTAKTASADESSTRSGTFSEKETTSRTPDEASLNELVQEDGKSRELSTSIGERHCSRHPEDENILTDSSPQTLPEESGGQPSPESGDSIDSDDEDYVKVELPGQEMDDLTDDYEEIMVLYRKMDDLENHLMKWSGQLSLDMPEEEWRRFQDEVHEQCQLLLVGLEGKEEIPASWPSIAFKKDDEVTLPYQYYTQLQLVLSAFPRHDRAVEDKFNAMHPDDYSALAHKISRRLEKVSNALNLGQYYVNAFSNNTNPVLFSIGEQGSEELGLTREDVGELQKKMGDCIIRQVSLAEKKDKSDPRTDLPDQFVRCDLPRSDYHVINEEGETLALMKPEEVDRKRKEGESKEDYQKRLDDWDAANEKKNAEVISHIQRLSPDLRVQQKICHFLTQNPLIGLSHGIRSEFIQPLFGAGFNLLGSEGFKTTFGKEEGSNKIKIQYELQRSNTRLSNPGMDMPGGSGMLMDEINERWGKSFMQFAINIVMDPENPDNVTAEGFRAHVEFPVT